LLRLLLVATAVLFAADLPDPSARIHEQLLAPCCWRENLATHQSPEAQRMRAEIAQLIESGKTETEIVDLYVERYGERILSEPRGQRSFWLNIVPWLALAAGASLLLRYLRQVLRQAPAVVAAAPPQLQDTDDEW
jgi:cytochrome c-type biogenesis protein CcmH